MKLADILPAIAIQADCNLSSKNDVDLLIIQRMLDILYVLGDPDPDKPDLFRPEYLKDTFLNVKTDSTIYPMTLHMEEGGDGYALFVMGRETSGEGFAKWAVILSVSGKSTINAFAVSRSLLFWTPMGGQDKHAFFSQTGEYLSLAEDTEDEAPATLDLNGPTIGS